MLESGLFGFKRGAFTGAETDKPGLFETVDGGTLFLDEITDASPATQAKLLRAVELGEIRRLGENFTRHVDVRIISATNKDIEKEVRKGRFREDLYFRLNSLTIRLPPLCERRGDILLLANFFLKKYNEQFNKGIAGLTPSACSALLNYAWPGNVRQLESAIRTAVLLADGTNQISQSEISATLGIMSGTGIGGIESFEEKFHESLNDTLQVVEDICIKEALAQTDGNISEAAKLLSTNRKRIQRRIQRWRQKDGYGY
jgi:transcriptional regulator with PAS, ATPase and Fis domain